VYKVNSKNTNSLGSLFLIFNDSILEFSPHLSLLSGLQIVLTITGVSKSFVQLWHHKSWGKWSAPQSNRYQNEPTNNSHNPWK